MLRAQIPVQGDAAYGWDVAVDGSKVRCEHGSSERVIKANDHSSNVKSLQHC
jgi:hypothetical protein